MKENYIYIYNNLIELTRNKNLYKDFDKQDNFSDRLTYFLIHFAFFFKVYKNKDNKKVAKLEKREIYFELLLFFCSLDKKINTELINGKKINVDNIGKFILNQN